MATKRALLIEFDLRTGKRAGGINNKDPKLLCFGWQDLESTPANTELLRVSYVPQITV